MNQKLRLVAFILGLSLIMSAGLLFYVESETESADTQKRAESPKILVFTQNLPAGHILSSGDVRWRPLDSSPAPAGGILKATQSELDLLGAPLKLAVVSGQLVREPLLGPKPNEAMLSYKLNPGYRAVTINVDAAQLASGRVLPNDYVDLLLTPGSQGGSLIPMPSMPSGQPTISGVTRVLDKVRILAIGGATELEKPETGQMDSSFLKDNSVTLELRPDDARRVLAANALGKISLLLRRPNDAADAIANPRPQGLAPLPRAAPPQSAPTPNSAPLGEAEPPSVIIVRGST